METFKDILCRQVDTLQHVFDSCAENAPEPDGSSSDEPSCKYYQIYALIRVSILHNFCKNLKGENTSLDSCP